MADAAAAFKLDPDKSNFVLVVGRKGSGKSKLAERYWLTYPHDRMVIDVTGDVPTFEGTKNVTAPIPSRFPIDLEHKQVSLRFQPDVGDPMHETEVDQAVGMCFHHPHQRCALWIDEVDVVSPNAMRLGPNMSRSLKQGRHKNLTLLACGIRPMAINPLFLSQADYVATFQLPNPDDRKRVANAIGIEPKEFDYLQTMLDEHEFLWCDVRAHDIVHCPPLPGIR